MTSSSASRQRAAAFLVGFAALVLLPGTAQSADTFVLGSGRARANVFEAVPRTGGLSIPFSFGRALVSYQGSRAEATATTGKPVFRPSQFDSTDAGPTAECGERGPGGGGGDPSAPPTASPVTSHLTVTSEEENSEAGKRAAYASFPKESPIKGEMFVQEVSATDDPLGRAISTSGRIVVPGLAEVTGGRAEASSGVTEGRTRLAEAFVVMDKLSLLGGLVTFEDARWEAIQRTGENEGADAAFTFGRVSIGGAALPALPASPGGDAPDPFAAINAALAPTGLVLDAPRVEESPKAARVTPLSVRFADSPLGRQVIGPALGALQPVRDPLVENLLSFSCDFGFLVTVADVMLSIASGSGAMSFDFGGVSTTTEGVRFDNPLAGPIDDGGLFDPGPIDEVPFDFPLRESPSQPAFSSELPGDLPFELPAVRFDPGPDLGAVDDPPPAFEEVAAPVPDSVIAQPALGSTSRRLSGHKGGDALLVGAIGLAAVIALAAADALYLRWRVS